VCSGTFITLPGHFPCSSPCPVGGYCIDGVFSQCPLGTSNKTPMSGAEEDCIECPVGRFAAIPGSVECMACPAGECGGTRTWECACDCKSSYSMLRFMISRVQDTFNRLHVPRIVFPVTKAPTSLRWVPPPPTPAFTAPLTPSCLPPPPPPRCSACRWCALEETTRCRRRSRVLSRVPLVRGARAEWSLHVQRARRTPPLAVKAQRAVLSVPLENTLLSPARRTVSFAHPARTNP
jgi:hypothetical protein